MNTIERIESRFRSGNSVPVERVSITADEWAAIKAVVEAARDYRMPIGKLYEKGGDPWKTGAALDEALSKLEGE